MPLFLPIQSYVAGQLPQQHPDSEVASFFSSQVMMTLLLYRECPGGL